MVKPIKDKHTACTCVHLHVHVHVILCSTDSIRWRKVHNGDTPARYEHAAFTHGGDLYVFAGAQTTGPLNDMWKYQHCRLI